jgi:predicted nucleic acid-binding protein
MKLVVDANILFAILIKQAITSEIAINSEFELFVPQYIYEEFQKYQELLREKIHRNENDFNETIILIKNIVKTIPKEEIMPYMKRAQIICPDKKDMQYFALAIKLNCAIWSNDKILKQQNKIKIYSTEDLIRKTTKEI